MQDGWYIGSPGIPDNYTVLEFVGTVKCLNDEGDICIIHTITPDIKSWEAIGMTTSLLDDMRNALAEVALNVYGEDEE